MQEGGESSNKKGLGTIVSIILILVALAAGAGGAAYLITVKPEFLGLSKGQVQAQNEAEKILAAVGKLIALPTDEKPTIATVSGVEKLKSQAFFKNAENGDKVLIYTNNKKAILYRPSEKRIIEVGAVNINQQPTAETPAPTITPKSTVEPKQ